MFYVIIIIIIKMKLKFKQFNVIGLLDKILLNHWWVPELFNVKFAQLIKDSDGIGALNWPVNR